MRSHAHQRWTKTPPVPIRDAAHQGIPYGVVEHAHPEQVRLVTLECPLERWHDPDVRELFDEMVELKRIGFAARYDTKVLPVDTTDFVARHVLSCVEGPQGLEIVAAYRAIDRERCRSFNLPFPAESLALASRAPDHAAAVRAYVGRGDPVGYLGSWTVHPGVRRNARLRAALQNHFALGGVLLHREVGVPRLMLGATLRFKVDRLIAPVGYRALCHRGKPMPALRAAHLQGESVQLMVLDDCRELTLPRTDDDLQRRWRTRIAL